MFLTALIAIIVAVCLVSTLIVYAFMRSHEKLNEKRQIRYPFTPSFGIITQKLTSEFPFRQSTPSVQSNRSSTTYYEENESTFPKSSKSVESLVKPLIPIRSSSMVPNLLQVHYPRPSSRRQGSIFDSSQIAAIQFTLPSLNNDAKYRRQSVPILHSVIHTKENPFTMIDSPSPCLLSFSIIYLKSSQLKIQFNALQGLPDHVQLQQLTIKVKLTPDGKEKSIQIRKLIEHETKFGNETNELCLIFSNIPSEKVQEKILTMNIHGKDQAKKTIHLGQIGKILFNQINPFQNEQRIEFTHEIEKVKASSMELLISLQKKDDQNIHVDLQRIKGLKIDQKKFDGKCYLQVLLLDHHRPLVTQQTEFYRLNSSNFILDEQCDLNILTFNSNNLDRFVILIYLYSNSNSSNEYKRIAHVKLASPLLCSGSGTVHWQQFKARGSFSMWHTLNKQQN